MSEDITKSILKPTTVLLVCNVRLYCDAIAQLLVGATEINFCGSAIPNDEIIEAYDAVTPDVVLLDTGGQDALPIALRLIQTRPSARILGFGVHDMPAQVVACAQAGLAGYVPNSASLQELIAATRRIATGDTVCSAAMADGLFRYLRRAAIELQPSPSDTPLTHRQQQIVRLLADGHSNKEIARRLSIGASTVKNHVHEILNRLNISSRNQISSFIHR